MSSLGPLPVLATYSSSASSLASFSELERQQFLSDLNAQIESILLGTALKAESANNTGHGLPATPLAASSSSSSSSCSSVVVKACGCLLADRYLPDPLRYKLNCDRHYRRTSVDDESTDESESVTNDLRRELEGIQQELAGHGLLMLEETPAIPTTSEANSEALEGKKLCEETAEKKDSNGEEEKDLNNADDEKHGDDDTSIVQLVDAGSRSENKEERKSACWQSVNDSPPLLEEFNSLSLTSLSAADMLKNSRNRTITSRSSVAISRSADSDVPALFSTAAAAPANDNFQQLYESSDWKRLDALQMEGEGELTDRTDQQSLAGVVHPSPSVAFDSLSTSFASATPLSCSTKEERYRKKYECVKSIAVRQNKHLRTLSRELQRREAFICQLGSARDNLVRKQERLVKQLEDTVDKWMKLQQQVSEERNERQKSEQIEKKRLEAAAEQQRKYISLSIDDLALDELYELEKHFKIAQDKVHTVIQRKLIRQNEETEERSRCIVCEDAAISVVLLPCAHAIVCKICATKLSQCPVDRKIIQQKMEIFGR